MNNEEKILELLGQMKTDINGMQTDIKGMQADISDLKQGQADIIRRVDKLEANDTDIIKRIDKLETNIERTFKEAWRDIETQEKKLNQHEEKRHRFGIV